MRVEMIGGSAHRAGPLLWPGADKESHVAGRARRRPRNCSAPAARYRPSISIAVFGLRVAQNRQGDPEYLVRFFLEIDEHLSFPEFGAKPFVLGFELGDL